MTADKNFTRPGRTYLGAIAVLASLTCAIAASSASAAGTVLFDQPFHNNTVNGAAGAITIPSATPVTKTNSACLSAAGNSLANPLASCVGTAPDTQGTGKLRITSNAPNLEGGVFASTSVPTSQGLDVTFNSYQYNAAPSGADGLAFVLAAVDPANPVSPASLGPTGQALGYSATFGTSKGLTSAYLGVGFDSHGNFSSPTSEGTGCTDPPNIAARMPGQVVVRGPGNNTAGYCGLQSSAATATSPSLVLHSGTSRTASLIPVEVVFNPSSSPVTTPSGLVVPAVSYRVRFTPVGGPAKDMVHALPVVPAGLYPASWVNASGFPKQLAFGWVASTGSSVDYHEIDDVKVSSLNPVPQLAVSQTSYAAATTAGSPVTYSVAASSSGAAEHFPVTVTQTLPAGVTPVGASGTGWVCGSPVGQQISCTNSTDPFTSGTITVNGVVSSGSVTPTLIQTATSAVASSGDGGPATSSSAPAGTVPGAPTLLTILPTNGPSGGDNAVGLTGAGLTAATAIEIGTTAEFAAGTPATLVACAVPARGCFTATGLGLSIDISSMPAHLAGPVTVKVVSLGIAASTSYTYNFGPALVATTPPEGETGVSYSKQFTVTGGTSPFTWSVSSGTLPPGLSLSASTGLLSGTPTSAGTYPFTVKVNDSGGLNDTAATSVTIIPGPSLGFSAPPTGWTHTVYGTTLTESGGTAPLTWSVSSGSLPAGISLSPSGNLSGTPTATGTSSFTVKVTDANGQFATQATSLTVSAGVSTTFAAPAAGHVGTAYTTTLTASGGTTPYAWSVNEGNLPTGMTLTSAGVLSGTPTSTGSHVFSVNVVDANGGIDTKTITLAIAANVSLSTLAPPAGKINVPYSYTITPTGGIGPYTWAHVSGTLPPGVTLGASTGVLSGTPTTAGTFVFSIKVTEANGVTSTKQTSIVVAPSAALTVSAPSVTYGAPVTLTVRMTPAAATGSVTFTALLSSGPQSGQTVTLGTAALSGGVAALSVTLPAFDTNTVTATYSGDATYVADVSAPVGVQVAAYNGEVIVNQFRLSGPGGADDQYAELYNTGPAVSLAGFRVNAGSGASVTLPSTAPVLATGHSYLLTGGGYSLGAVAASDSSVTNLGSGGLRVLAPDAAATAVDAVGSVGSQSGYFAGTALPALTGTPTGQYDWVRSSLAGLPVHTGSNAADYKLVSTTGGMIGGVQSMLGSPSPVASGSPSQRNGVLQSTLLDATKGSAVTPNREYVAGAPGLLTVRRKITNTSGATITSAKVRITSLSEANGPPQTGAGNPPPSPAALRVVNPATATSQVTTAAGVVTVQNLSVDAPATASPGGGLGTTLTVPVAGGLAAGATVNVAFTFAVDRGGSYWFGYNVDGLNGSAGFAAVSVADRDAATIVPAPTFGWRAATARTPANAGGSGALPKQSPHR